MERSALVDTCHRKRRRPDAPLASGSSGRDPQVGARVRAERDGHSVPPPVSNVVLAEPNAAIHPEPPIVFRDNSLHGLKSARGCYQPSANQIETGQWYCLTTGNSCCIRKCFAWNQVPSGRRPARASLAGLLG